MDEWRKVGLFGLIFGRFFPPRSLPDVFFFLTRNEGEKFVKGAKWIQGGKNTPEEQKKRVRKAGPLLKRGAESALFYSSI